MEITDLNGKTIKVTDLKLVLLQADDYRHYRHTDPAYADRDKKLQAYWEDIYQKLSAIKS